MSRRYLTVSLPYVNARPHLGYALELVQADTIARSWRARGADVRVHAGTDDNSLKNVLAADAAGVAVADLVATNADRFAALHGPLSVEVDDLIRTSTDPRHRLGVEALWSRTQRQGDLYQGRYHGAYCVGCEQFYAPADLPDGVCPEHLTEPEEVSEPNWFFRLSRYAPAVRDAITRGRIRIVPEQYAHEVVSFLDGPVADISVSRSVRRARGWGIGVPGDPEQVVYVWWDALGNYVTALGFGGPDETAYDRWWLTSEVRAHVIGKGILKFHAVYWPALLLSAGLPLPTHIYVHPYLTADGRKLSKSVGATVDPLTAVDEHGTDALRWWLLRDVPRVADADFTDARVRDRADADLANRIGNTVHRIATLASTRPVGVPSAAGEHLLRHVDELTARSAGAVDRFDFPAATNELLRAATEINRFVDETQPWLPGQTKADDLAALVASTQKLVAGLQPYIPVGAAALAEQLRPGAAPAPVFPRRAQCRA